MNLALYSMSGDLIAQVPVLHDARGYMYAKHPTFQFEVDCALYGFQEGGVNADTIDDADGNPYVKWEVSRQPIKKGDVVHIHPDWKDEGDDKYTWVAVEDEVPGRSSIDIMPLDTGLRFPPVQRVSVFMIEGR